MPFVMLISQIFFRLIPLITSYDNYLLSHHELRGFAGPSRIGSMKIGQTLRQIREAQGSTLEDVAYLAQTTASNLSRIERGRHGCSPDMLERIAQALSMTVADIYRLEDGDSKQGSARGVQEPRHTSPRPSIARHYEQLTVEHREIVDDFVLMLLRRQRQAAEPRA